MMINFRIVLICMTIRYTALALAAYLENPLFPALQNHP